MSVMHGGIDIQCDIPHCSLWENVATQSVRLARAALYRRGWRLRREGSRMLDICPRCAQGNLPEPPAGVMQPMDVPPGLLHTDPKDGSTYVVLDELRLAWDNPQ